MAGIERNVADDPSKCGGRGGKTKHKQAGYLEASYPCDEHVRRVHCEMIWGCVWDIWRMVFNIWGSKFGSNLWISIILKFLLELIPVFRDTLNWSVIIPLGGSAGANAFGSRLPRFPHTRPCE